MNTSAAVAEDVPCDLLEFMAQQRQIEVAAAAGLLGDFLIQYEPQCAALRCVARRLAA